MNSLVDRKSPLRRRSDSRFLTLVSLGFIFISSSVFATESDKPCFDFTQKSTELLRPAPAHFDPAAEAKGKTSTGFDFAWVSGVVEKPILEIYQKLLNPKTVRDSDSSQVEVKETPSENYLKLLEQSITIHPIVFLSLHWKEDWGYALKEGTAQAPAEIIISYQKKEGTTYITHLCGNFQLKQLGPTQTGIYLYQEMLASHRDAQNILNDVSGTLRTLKK